MQRECGDGAMGVVGHFVTEHGEEAAKVCWKGMVRVLERDGAYTEY